MFDSENMTYIEDMLRRYLQDPNSVEASWRAWFEGEGREYVDQVMIPDGPSLPPAGLYAPKGAAAASSLSSIDADLLRAQSRISQFINAYRVRGHYAANLDPLDFVTPPSHPELDPAYWGLDERYQDQSFSTGDFHGKEHMSLRELEDWLKDTYSRTIGVEFMHIDDIEIKDWLQEKFERNRNRSDFDANTQAYLYQKLSQAELFENFIHTKFRGAKRFSLEGGESVMPLLSLIIESAASHGAKEVVLGMAHRGRLNVLANITGKPASKIFAEFQDKESLGAVGQGDVKYHLGYESIQTTRLGDEVKVSLTFNPSHLESVNPVVQGKVRALQDRLDDSGKTSRRQVVPLLIHGDAAFTGQGVVAETINMAGLEAYTVGGTIHVIINNQIGFTTNPQDERTSYYCTEVAKSIQAPIIHVNGEDPEAVAHVAKIAGEFRQRFQRDIVIDLFCYRKYGHNEGDEPAFTQPLMYAKIDAHPPVHEIYRDSLISKGLITKEACDAIDQSERDALEKELARTESESFSLPLVRGPWWEGYLGGADKDVPMVDTKLSESLFDEVIQAITRVPEGFNVNRKILRLLKGREAASDPQTPIDWGLGEMLAYGSLVAEKAAVRMSGQDVTRGTFSHRHAGVFDGKTAERYLFLKPFAKEHGGRFDIYNSSLSEAAVLGFEYGYALDTPDGLVVWEAQFGDFSNGAQIIMDQFIFAGEDKWNILSALTMLLPHGFEGMGPEHSSARPERFLQLAADDNMQVMNLTTPAQIFHALRQQVLRPWRKPLVVMSPKSLLRNKHAVSYKKDFTEGRFQRVIPEDRLTDLKKVKRAILSSGKVYYDLLEHREALKDEETALIRLEQLFPFPEKEVLEALSSLPALEELVFCQEEPQNMGAFHFLYPIFDGLFEKNSDVKFNLRYVTRPAAASPATGSKRVHDLEQAALVKDAFTR